MKTGSAGLGHRDPGGHLGGLGQLVEQRAAQVTERELTPDELAPSRISAVPSVYRGPGRVSRRKPAASRVRASASVLLLEMPSAARPAR